MERGQLGHLTVNDEGAVINSGGDLENDEYVARVLFNVVRSINKHGLLLPEGCPSPVFHRLTVHYGTHFYTVALSNKRFHIVKCKYVPLDPVPV